MLPLSPSGLASFQAFFADFAGRSGLFSGTLAGRLLGVVRLIVSPCSTALRAAN